MPTRMPLSLINLTKATPLSECWYSVSWKKMTPPRQLLMRSSALKRICRYCLRFSSVFSTPTWASRFAMLPVINTAKVLILLHSIHSLVGLHQRVNGGEVRYRPTDSSAARMPFPGETIRRAVSWSSLFCPSVSVGSWCVILTLWLSYSLVF